MTEGRRGWWSRAVHLRRQRAAGGDAIDRDPEALAELSDAALTEEYYRLRDERGSGREADTYPNIKRLFGTPFEREKDRREVAQLAHQSGVPEAQRWYETAAERSCVWWVEHQLTARHSLDSCMSCGVCTSLCPAARFNEDYNPRAIVDVALSRDEERLIELLRADALWLCGQCGSCKPACPRGNSVMGLVSSLRLLAQVKGLHVASPRGRQQYVARHLWGGNFWNRACSLYFRNPSPETHRDFGPRYARHFSELDAQMRRLGANPDTDGDFGGRKIAPETLTELRRLIEWGGTLALWQSIEQSAVGQARELGLSPEAYLEQVGREG